MQKLQHSRLTGAEGRLVRAKNLAPWNTGYFKEKLLCLKEVSKSVLFVWKFETLWTLANVFDLFDFPCPGDMIHLFHGPSFSGGCHPRQVCLHVSEESAIVLVYNLLTDAFINHKPTCSENIYRMHHPFLAKSEDAAVAARTLLYHTSSAHSFVKVTKSYRTSLRWNRHGEMNTSKTPFLPKNRRRKCSSACDRNIILRPQPDSWKCSYDGRARPPAI